MAVTLPPALPSVRSAIVLMDVLPRPSWHIVFTLTWQGKGPSHLDTYTSQNLFRRRPLGYGPDGCAAAPQLTHRIHIDPLDTLHLSRYASWQFWVQMPDKMQCASAVEWSSMKTDYLSHDDLASQPWQMCGRVMRAE